MLSCPVVANSRARRKFREKDEDFANETKMDNNTFERALPGGPVKMKTSSADQDNYSIAWAGFGTDDSDVGTIESIMFWVCVEFYLNIE